jgi:hypothetical protein
MAIDRHRPAPHAVLQLQRSAGNTVVRELLRRTVQRDDAPPGPDVVPPGPQAVSVAPPADFSIALPGAQASYAVGDLQAIDPAFAAVAGGPPPVVSTLRIGVVQRQPAPTGLPDKPSGSGNGSAGDADAPHLSSDVGASFPWSLTTTVVYRNLNFATFPRVPRGLDILHAPQATFGFTISPSSLVSTQLGVGLVNLHLPSLFGSELEAQIPLSVQSSDTSGASASIGIQLEQHIWKGISATFSLTGTLTLPGIPPAPAPGADAPALFPRSPRRRAHHSHRRVLIQVASRPGRRLCGRQRAAVRGPDPGGGGCRWRRGGRAGPRGGGADAALALGADPARLPDELLPGAAAPDDGGSWPDLASPASPDRQHGPVVVR